MQRFLAIPALAIAILASILISASHAQAGDITIQGGVTNVNFQWEVLFGQDGWTTWKVKSNPEITVRSDVYMPMIAGGGSSIDLTTQRDWTVRHFESRPDHPYFAKGFHLSRPDATSSFVSIFWDPFQCSVAPKVRFVWSEGVRVLIDNQTSSTFYVNTANTGDFQELLPGDAWWDARLADQRITVSGGYGQYQHWCLDMWFTGGSPFWMPSPTTPTSTGTPTTSATPTSTPTPTSTQTVTSTNTPTVSSTPTKGVVQTTPPVRTRTATPTRTPTRVIRQITMTPTRTPTRTPTLTATRLPAMDNRFDLSPYISNAKVGQVTTIDIMVYAPTGIDGAAAYLNFDPKALQVVGIETIHDKLPIVLQKQIDNVNGHVDLAMGTLSRTLPTGRFVIARLKVVGIRIGSTSIEFTLDVPNNRNTDLTRKGTSLFEGSQGANINVTQ